MRSMTFLVNDRSTGSGPTPAVAVTVTENANGTVSIAVNVVGGVIGDLRGFFFDVANESRIGTLSVTPTSPGFTEFRQGNDNVRDLGNGANMNGLLGSDGGYDAGVEIGRAGTAHGDDYQSFSFTLRSSAGPLTLDDFANVDVGVRLTSVGRDENCHDDDRDGDARLLEHTVGAYDAKDDAAAVTEDAPVNQAGGNVFGNDLNVNPLHLITAVNGSAANIGNEIQGVYGTFRLNLNGSYTYTLDNSRAATQALAAGQQVVESFSYTAKNFDELTSFSTDTASVRITVTGAADNVNAAPVITAAIATGAVTELADHAPGEGTQIHSAVGTVNFSDVNLTDSHAVSVAAAAAGYLGTLNASVTNPSTGDGAGQATWNFQVADGAIEHLGAGESRTQSYTLSINDGHGGAANQQVTITITGANDAPVITAATATGAVTELADGAPGEGTALHSASGSVNFSDIDLSDAHSVSVTAAAAGYLGALSAAVTNLATGDGAGQVTWSFQVADGAIEHLGAGESRTQSYTLSINDGHGGTANQQVTITITGSNDAPTITGGTHSGPVEEDGVLAASGTVNFTDLDLSDAHGISVTPAAPGYLGTLSAAMGNDSTGDGVGQVGWSFQVSNSAVQYLGAGDSVTQTYVISVNDGHGGTATQNVDIIINGANDAPEIVAGDTNGSVFEDGSRRDSGQLVATDVDQGDVLTWSTAGAGAYGTLSVDAGGQWSYALNNGAANVQALAQGEHVTDTFSVAVADGHGGFDTQTVTVDVAGSNDAPLINQAASTAFGSTNEDFVLTASGQIIASDIDHGAVLEWTVGPVTQVPLAGGGFQVFGYRADYHFTLDQLTIGRNGATVFDDTFSDGIAPPSGSAFAGVPTSYLASGGYTESGGRLHLDGLRAASQRGIENPDLTVGQLAVLATNNDPNDLLRGLKIDDDFTVEARYDLATPGVGQAYGFTLTDNSQGGVPVDQLGDSNMSLLVRRAAGGGMVVNLSDFDVVTDDATTFESVAFTPLAGEDQIVLRVIHDADNPGIVHAAFDLLSSGSVTRTFTFAQTAHAFGAATPDYAGDDETFTRVQLVAFGPDISDGTSLQGTYGTLSVQQNGQWTYALDPIASQGLAQFQFAQDVFSVRVTDEHGLSSFRPVFITVTGSNDAPFMLTAQPTGEVEEDADLTASGNVVFSDVDLIDTHIAGFSASPSNTTSLGTFSLSPVSESPTTTESAVTWTYTLNNDAAQSLAAGQVATETYTITLQDNWGAFTTQDVTLTINGANDAPEIVAGDTTGSVFEDGARRDSGQLIAHDVDQGSTLTWSASGTPPIPAPLRADYRYSLDNLNIVRNGTQFFNDDFGNGTPPPSGTTFGYFTSGSFIESGGRLIMDGSLGAPGTLFAPGSAGTLANSATLNTDISSDPTQGLKRAQDFRVEARYDLVMPENTGSEYAVRLNDGVNDLIDLGVRRAANGTVTVVLRESDAAATTLPTTLQEVVLAPAAGDNQIVLRLSHAANADFVTASFDLLNNGIVTQTFNFTPTPDIFDGETWTRVQAVGFSPAQLQNGQYGTLAVNADGEWKYSLANGAANVQALAQGEHATDTFTVTVTDEHGASDTQTVSIDVAGSNDAPVVNVGASTTQGNLIEDGFATAAAGQIIATDVDHGAHLTWSVGPDATFPLGALPPGSQVNGYNADYHFTLDQLRIERNGATVFNDQYDDGLPPPSAPNFGGFPSSYLLTGGYQEFGGRLHLVGSLAVAQRGIDNPNLTVGQLATLVTNNDPNDLTRGLKSDDDFTVEARYDLALPDAGEVYGITLTDNTTNGLPADQLGDSSMSLLVRRDAGGNLIVRLSDFNVVTDHSDQRQELSLEPLPDETQIVLRLVHDKDDAGIVHAEFDLVGPGGVRTFQFTEVAHIFGSATPGYAGDDENWTRVQMVAFGPDAYAGNTDAQGVYGTLSVNQNGQWNYTLDPVASQQLAQGQTMQEYFPVRVTDEFGLSSMRNVTVNVTGVNDPVQITSAVASGDVTEDAVLSAAGSINFSDVDLIDFHSFMSTASPFNTTGLGSFILGPVSEFPGAADGSVGWTYVLNNDAADYLAEGQTVFETYRVTIADPFGSMVSQDVTIAIHGADDGGTPPVANPDTNDADPVREFGAPGSADPFATGNVLLNDVNPGGPLQVATINGVPVAPVSGGAGGTTVGGTYGSLHIQPDGLWHYTLDDLDPDTDSLSQGESVVDQFTYTVENVNGASSTTLSIAITGANDAPSIAGGDTGDVTEGGQATASGQLAGFDPDHGASLHYSMNGTPAADYHFAIDQFTVTRQRPADAAPITILSDGFTDNAPPPSSPLYSNGVAAGYGVRGGFTEHDGKVFLDGGQALSTFNLGVPGLMLANFATALTTSTGTDPNVGLRITHDFDIAGRFDAILPDTIGEGYGIAFSDQNIGTNGNFGDDIIQLMVRLDEDGVVRVVLREADFFANTATPIGSVELGAVAAGDQIVLHLRHDADLPGLVSGSFDVVHAGVTTAHTIAGNGQIFGTETPGSTGDDEAFTRGQFFGLSPATSATRIGIYGSLTLDLTNGEWHYALDNNDPDTQALGAGATAVDSFDVTVIDQFNFGSAGAINVTVHGTGQNTPPVAVADTNAGDPVVENGFLFFPGNPNGDPLASGNVLTNDFDPDPNPGLHVTAINGLPLFILGQGTYGTLMMFVDGTWTYTLNDADPDTDALPQGAAVSDQFTYTIEDAQGASASATLTVAITGANDAPVALNDSVTEGVTEDAAVSIAVLANDHDVDTGDVLHAGGLGSPTGNALSMLGAKLSVNPDGTVQYDPRSSAAVQALAAGETLTDTFFYAALDQNGASGVAQVSVVVQGADEPPADGQVFEDGSRHASGALTPPPGVDPDGTLSWTVTNSSVIATPDYRFLLDNLSIIRNGTTYFNDDFGAGGPPPQAPNLNVPPPNTVSYSLLAGTTIAEANGRAILDGSFSAPITSIGSSDPFHGQLAVLQTDGTSNLALGLKIDDNFTLEGRFDLVLPDVLQAYGVRLVDQPGSDIVDVRVRTGADGIVSVALRDVDVPGNVQTALASLPLVPLAGENQIALRLTHAASDPGTIHAYFDLLNGGILSRSFELGAVGHIFGTGTPGDPSDDEVYTRAQITATGPSDLQNGAYGTLHVNGDGEWTYALDNTAPLVQALAQGEHATDTFNISVSDGLGGHGTKTVSVDVVGTDDAPLVVSSAPTAFNGGYVVEDGGQQAVSGVALGFDPDHGAALHWSVSRNPYSSNYLVQLDDLSITKNGAAFFQDNFNDNVAPPSAPTNFSYLVSGGISETGGRAILNGQLAVAQRGIGTDELVVGNLLTVGTNIDPNDLTRGLKSDDDFTVGARFDLSVPAENGQGYGVSLNDNTAGGLPADQLGDDLVAVELVRDNGGNLRVRFAERDVVADTVTEFGSTPFAALPGEDQIVLQLTHDHTNLGAIHASFDVFNHGVLSRHVDIAGTGHIFGTDTPDYAGDDEDWTRVQATAFGRDSQATSVQGTYGNLSIDPATGAWTYALNNASPAVQNLPHGTTALDGFNVRVLDEYGVSTNRPYNFTVVGTGDPAPTGPLSFIGSPASDVGVGSSGGDTFVGGGGSDLLIGLGGADTFDYNNLSEAGDTISDFNPGQGDKLDLHDLLLSLPGYVPGVTDPTQLVFFNEFPPFPGARPGTAVVVDNDGVPFGQATQVAFLDGTTGLQMSELLANGNLIL